MLMDKIRMDNDHVVYLIGFSHIRQDTWFYFSDDVIKITDHPMPTPWKHIEMLTTRSFTDNDFNNYIKPRQELVFEYDDWKDIYFCHI